MFKMLMKIPFNYLERYFNFIAVLPFSLTFSVTYKCNFECKTCNIWKNDFKVNELNLSQIESIFSSLGRSLRWITIDGGEPFLREDLADICEIVYENCKPAVINIPSNASLPEKTMVCIKRILKKCPNSELIINLSLDHIGEKHDSIRGFVGSFQRFLNTYQALKGIKHPRLRIGINTVISSYNIKEWETIYLLGRKLESHSHLFEIAQLRDEFRNKNLDYIVPERKEGISLFRKLFHLTSINKKTLSGKCLYAVRKNYYSLIEKSLALNQQIIPCFAGISSAYVLPDGKVWACCNNAQVMGDLKEYNFNFKRLWHDKPARDIRQRIKRDKCFCFQANTSYLNLIHSPLYLSKIIYDLI